MRLWITHFTQLGLQLGWSLSLSYKFLDCINYHARNPGALILISLSLFLSFFFFLSFFKFWCLSAAAVLLGKTAKLSSHQVFITRPGLFFISLSLSSFCLSIPPLCLPSSLHPINAVAWLYKAHHDSINSVISFFFLSLSFDSSLPISEWLAFELFMRYSQTTFLCRRSNRQQHHE